MSRPPFEAADLIRSAGSAFLERNRHWLSWKHVKVLLAITRCRTAALGEHLDQCTRCGHRAISYNSCRNRHYPSVRPRRGNSGSPHARWVKSRERFFLSIHVLRRVFRGKFVAALQRAFREDRLRFRGSLMLLARPKDFAAWLRSLFRKDWVVYETRLRSPPVPVATTA
jgi:Transposase zinc-binding domain/Putative transposase